MQSNNKKRLLYLIAICISMNTIEDIVIISNYNMQQIKLGILMLIEICTTQDNFVLHY